MVNDKSKVRKSCKKCETTHTKNEHRFHGYGSFRDTHLTYCRRRCCEAQKDSRCYIPKERKRIAHIKTEFWKTRKY